MSGQLPKMFKRAQILATLNLLDEKDSGQSHAKDQENASCTEFSVSKEELRSEDVMKTASDISATSDATTLPVTSNGNQSPVSSNPSIADSTAGEETANDKTKWVFISFGSKEKRKTGDTQRTHRTIESIQAEPKNVKFTFKFLSIIAG